MKKIFAILLIFVLALSASGCSDNSSVANGETGKLSIYMLNDSQYARDAIACYMAVAPYVEMDIEVGVPDYDTTVSDALKKLNTRLLSGNGPDIILMDDIQLESYIQSGQLMDLTGIVEEAENLAHGVVENTKFNGKVYAIPLSVTLMANIKRADTSVDFSSLGKFNESIKTEHAVIGSFDRQAALWYRTQIEPELLQEREITDEKLRTFYQDLYEQMDMIYGNDKESRFASFQQINLQAVSGLVAPHVFFKKIGASKEYIDTLSYLQMLCSMGNESGLDFSFCRWQDKDMYIPMNRIAICSKSKNSEGAAALIEYLLSEEGQQQIAKSTGCIPVNSKVLRSVMENSEEREYVIGEAGSYKAKPFTEKNVEQIFDLLNENSYSVTTDGMLMEIIMLGAQDYLNGNLSLDAATRQTLKKVGIYFAE
ncbi:MAG: extracellular solute-binding protein [Clostridia bacterium]|nr:extracellular solute-binding protein [Clostridia bacterium]